MSKRIYPGKLVRGEGGYKKQTGPKESIQDNWSRGRGVIKSKLIKKNLYRKTGPGGGGLTDPEKSFEDD